MLEANQLDWLEFLQDIMGSHETNSLRPFLSRARELFQMGSGFVYEADHTGLLHLRDYQSDYGVKHLPRQLNLRAALGTEQYLEFSTYPVMARLGQQSSGLGNALCKVFTAQSYILAPVLGDGGEITALVGFADRRTGPQFLEEELRLLELIISAFISKIRLRRYQEGLEASRQVLSDVLDNTGVDVYVVDFFTYEVLYCNKSMAEPYGGLDKLVGKRCWEALYDDKTAPCDFCVGKYLLDEEGNPCGVYSWDYQRPFDKSWFRVLSVAFRWSDGRLAQLTTSVDITENKRNEELISKLANTDVTTGLYSRTKLLADIADTESLPPARRDVLFCDLNDFKNINDAYGHTAGDDLLAEIGVFLRENIVGHSLYRYGGDELLIVCEEGDEQSVEDIQEMIVERFSKLWNTSAGEVACTVSVGRASIPEDTDSISQAIQLADQAMYRAKQGDPNSIFAYNKGDLKRIR